MTKTFGVALLGCGTVGASVAQLLLNHSQQLAQSAGQPFALHHVVVRDLAKPRPVELPHNIVATDWWPAIRDPQVNVVVELFGGTTSARGAIMAALDAGKHVVTANKALLAHHGAEVFSQAHANDRAVTFEASVAGGIPIIGALTHGLAANEIQSIQGILNGTCNYILSQMTHHGHDYATALQSAQQQGFAEADPTLDVDGSDAAHKLGILARLAFHADVPIDDIAKQGIQSVTPLDIRLARELGYVFKLIAEARRVDGQLSLHVGPSLVKQGTPLADVSGANNALQVRGDAVGSVFLAGPGAGGMPTASAVVSDMIEVASGRAQLTFQRLRLWEPGRSKTRLAPDDVVSRFYLRLSVHDRPGVLAEITSLLAKEQISVASVIQHESTEDDVADDVTVAILTHAAPRRTLLTALSHINASPHSRHSGVAIPVL